MDKITILVDTGKSSVEKHEVEVHPDKTQLLVGHLLAQMSECGCGQCWNSNDCACVDPLPERHPRHKWRFAEGDKVLHKEDPDTYDFGYYSAVEGKCVIYIEGERNMQDSYAVELADIKLKGGG